MPKLFNQTSGELISEISSAQLTFLIDQLEEEDSTDQDYFINGDTLTMLREADADPDLIAILEKAMGEAGEVDILWK